MILDNIPFGRQHASQRKLDGFFVNTSSLHAKQDFVVIEVGLSLVVDVVEAPDDVEALLPLLMVMPKRLHPSDLVLHYNR
jgi:hypothetical protein